MSQSMALEKAFAFALRIIKLHKYLSEEKSEYFLSKAVRTSGTHIGKYVKESLNDESRPIFIGGMATAHKKASETEYWLELLHASEYLDEKAFVSINRRLSGITANFDLDRENIKNTGGVTYEQDTI